MNKKTLRSHREILQEDLARPLLNVPIPGTGDSAWQNLERARTELQMAVALANEALEGNPLAEILAEHAMRLSGRRGFPQVVVDADGSVMLEVRYDAPMKGQVEGTKVTRKKSSSLPSIDKLRSEAESLGIQTAAFGKAKTKLMEAIRLKSNGTPQVKPEVAPPQPAVVPTEVSDPATPKMTRMAPALTPARVLVPDSQVVTTDDEDDVAVLFRESGTQRRGVPAGTPSAPATNLPPRTPKGRSLSAIVAAAEVDVNLDALLSKPPPPPPPAE